MELYIRPDYEVVRNESRCIACRVCERQCANEVHSFDPETGMMKADESKCVNCHRCVSLCPTHALKIVKTDDVYKRERQLGRADHQRGVPTGQHGRCAALFDGQPQALPRVLG